MGLTLALSGDSIINRRVSVCDDLQFQSLVDQFRTADIGFTHLETLLHDYDDPGVYPAAEAGGTWMRSPPSTAEELEWLGLDLVSHASNHALDYSYGALEATWSALDDVGIGYAGTGNYLAEARAPTYRETSGGRVGLVSMTTSYTSWSVAGEMRRDMGGRPGVNPLGTHYRASPAYIERIKAVAEAMNFWITPEEDSEWAVNPPGLHNTIHRFVEDASIEKMRRTIDEPDRRGNLRAVAEADQQSDLALAHVHTHAWDENGDLSDPPAFLTEFARECVDAGADVVVCQGSHAPLRGIELYDGCPIFYDPGDFFMMSDSVEALPATFYNRYGSGSNVHDAEGMPGEALSERGVSSMFGDIDDSDSDYSGKVANPPGGYFSGRVVGNVLPVCEFDDDYSVRSVTLHPGYLRDAPTLYRGVPARATGSKAHDVIEYVGELSEQYGTTVKYEDGVGVVDV